MMKKFKQFIAFVLTLCMLFSLSVAALFDVDVGRQRNAYRFRQRQNCRVYKRRRPAVA